MSFHGFIANFFSVLNNKYPLVQTYRSLYIHPPTEGQLIVYKFWQLWIGCYKHTCAAFCVDISFQCFWVNSKCDLWIVWKLCVLSPTSLVPWTVTHQAPLFTKLSRQEYWSGLPFPPPGDLPNTRIEHMSLVSPALVSGFFTTSTTWEFTFFLLNLVVSS